MDRAVSTVLDVAICLLLVGAAITALSIGPPEADRGVDSDEPATVLATSTAAVPTGIEDHRTHDTLVGHLATAAVFDAEIDGEPLTESPYPAAVEKTVDATLGARTFVTATWDPAATNGSTVRGTVRAGNQPPAGATVGTTTVEVTVVSRGPRQTTAAAVIDRLFPPERSRHALLDARTASETATRYRQTADVLGTSVESDLNDATTVAANAALEAALDRHLAEGADHTVRVTIRRWEE
ncbi:MAG: hypothetical protein PPP58_08975 [Natronomonas sp.]